MITDNERTATERKRRVEKYFIRTPDNSDKVKATVTMSAAGLLAVIGLAITASSAPLGLILLAVAMFVAYRGYRRLRTYLDEYHKAEPKPSGRELDLYLASDLNTIEKQAMQALDLTEDDLETGDQEWDPVEALAKGEYDRPKKRPIVVFGPDPESGFALGDDKIWRFRTYEVMVICPTRHHLALFRTELSLLSGGLFHEQTQEYQYGHVVSVSTTTVAAPMPITRADLEEGDLGQVRFAKAVLKQFELGVSSGRSSHVTVGISDANHPDDKARLPDSGIQQVIGSVRRVLRDKKGAL
jgi:hypothetical protein